MKDISREAAENIAVRFDLTETFQAFESLIITQAKGVELFNIELRETRMVESNERMVAMFASVDAMQQFFEHYGLPTLIRIDGECVAFNTFALTPLDVNELFGPLKLIHGDENSSRTYTTTDRYKVVEVSNE